MFLNGGKGDETSWWYKAVGKKIVDKSDGGVRSQDIGWIDKSRFLNTAYVDRYGKLYYRKRKMIHKKIQIACSFYEQEYYYGSDNYEYSFLQEQTWESKGRITMSSKSDNITVLDTDNDIGWFPYPLCLQCISASGWFQEKSRFLSYKVLVLFGIYAFRLRKRNKGEGNHFDSGYRRASYCRIVHNEKK